MIKNVLFCYLRTISELRKMQQAIMPDQLRTLNLMEPHLQRVWLDTMES